MVSECNGEVTLHRFVESTTESCKYCINKYWSQSCKVTS